MKKEDIISIFKDVIEKAGYEELLTVSDNVNQLADIMIYCCPSKEDMFAMDGEPLFPVCQISNILYDFGKEKSSYMYVGTELMIKLELKDGSSYVIEDGDQGLCGIFYFNQKRFTDYGEIQKALKEYNKKLGKSSFVAGLFYSVIEMIETGEAFDNIELSPIIKEVYSYIDQNPDDIEFFVLFCI